MLQTFIHFSSYAVKDFTGDEICIKNLENAIKDFYNDPTQGKLAIPLILPSLSLLEEKHIVMIFIDKDTNSLEYFDSKGITSENRYLKAKNKMSDVLSSLKKVFPNKNDIIIQENASVLQMDCHNCGAYITWFAARRLQDNATNIIKKGISSNEIRVFRKGMKAGILPPG